MSDGRGYFINVSDFVAFYESHSTDVYHIPGETEIAAPRYMWKLLYPLNQGGTGLERVV
jgi:hypothetical protein